MKRVLFFALLMGSLVVSNQALAQGGCATQLESIESASMDEVSAEYLRLLSYKNPYCDTTGSDFEKLMYQLEKLLVADKAAQAQVLAKMGEPYYQGTLNDYENQKLTVGRDGKATGKALPPSYKIPTGEYYIVYLWRKKDYIVFALTGGKISSSGHWVKGDYR